jgi:tetraacyldisaccharide 4'-kinase
MQILLMPVTWLFRLLVWLRRSAYQAGWVSVQRLPVPVMVVGNISAGGTGKTPLVVWLCNFLVDHGYQPGVVSRGYGGSGLVQEVTQDSEPGDVGDEPVLIARRGRCPIFVGRDRVAAARALLEAYPKCDFILSDDGLQHYRMARDFEIAVVDGAKGFGNGFMLLAGPLREPRSRLSQVDAVVLNGKSSVNIPGQTFSMNLEGNIFHNILDPDARVTANQFHGRRIHAVAGIGNPRRFFRHLKTLDLHFSEHAFPDHHAYKARDLQFSDADVVLMTEKDAIKCEPFAQEDWWYLSVDAKVDNALQELITSYLLSRSWTENFSKS